LFSASRVNEPSPVGEASLAAIRRILAARTTPTNSHFGAMR
jgi:hypothetical protein